MMMDRISNLPDNVIDIILEKLALNERIKTSALSRSWRLRWTHLPSLTLDHRNIYRHLSCTANNLRVPPKICLPIINSILVQLESQSIKNLVLVLLPHTPPDPDCDKLLELAVGLVSRMQDRSLERLNINYNPIYDHPLYRLPSSALFSLLHLKHLTLTGCRICCLPFPSPSSSQSHQFQVQPGFPNLISFILMRCTVTALSSLLSNCPNLQNLQLELVDLGADDHTLDFNGPKLRYFDIDPSCKNVILRNNANNLENLNFCHRLPDKFIDSSSTLQIFSSSLKKVRLGGQACKRLARSAITLPTFSLVKDLQFRLICRYDLEQLQSLLRFCACCPHLERLTLHMLRDSSVHAADRDLQPEFEFESFIRKYSTTTFQLVKSVVLVQVFGAIWEMKIIEIILKMCPILEHMTILFRWVVLISFPRASSKVEFSCIGSPRQPVRRSYKGFQ